MYECECVCMCVSVSSTQCNVLAIRRALGTHWSTSNRMNLLNNTNEEQLPLHSLLLLLFSSFGAFLFLIHPTVWHVKSEKWKTHSPYQVTSSISVYFALTKRMQQKHLLQPRKKAQKNWNPEHINRRYRRRGGREKREKRREPKMEISNAAASGVSSLVYNCRTVRSKCCIYEGRGKRRQRRVGTEWTQSEQSIRLILSWLSKLHFMCLHSLRWAFKTLQYY